MVLVWTHGIDDCTRYLCLHDEQRPPAACFALCGDCVMPGDRLPGWTQWVSLGLVFSLVLLVALLSVKGDDPCKRMPARDLIAFYPELDELARKHRLQTDQLLTLHRTQDVLVNLKMSSEQIDPEEALRISLRQVKEVAALRKAQAEEFGALCRKVVKRGWQAMGGSGVE